MRLKSKLPLSAHGAGSNASSRFLEWQRGREATDDAGEPDIRPVRLHDDTAKSIITYNDSPDIPFDRSLNLARGCAHGCVYCYARPSHAYLGLSPGLDFETEIYIKRNAAELLRQALSRPSYRPAPIALGANTDPYQPFERELRITRSVIEVLSEFRHPVLITTKGSLIERDVDLLAPMAALDLVQVMVSIATLDAEIARRLEPRAASPARRLKVVRTLAQSGIPVGVIVAPVVPALTDGDIERVLAAARDAGARSAAYVFLRLPREVRDLFVEWLQANYPARAAHVMSLIRQSRGGADNDSTFGQRMSGDGAIADMIRQRFHAACRRLGFDANRHRPLRTDLFRPPAAEGDQLALF
jgi:DNA repair photolyase